MSDTNTAFAEWLRNARVENGMSQQKVADAMRKAGHLTFRQTKVAKIEQARTAIFLDEAVALAGLFGTTLDVALGLKPDSRKSLTASVLARRTDVLQQVQALVDAELGGAS